MFVPPYVTPADLYAFPNCKINGFVGHYDVSPLAEGRNDAGNCRKRLSVDNACLSAKMGGDVSFGLDMHVLGAVEPWRGARAYAVGAEDLNGAFLEVGIGTEGVEIVGGKIGYCTAV